MKWCFSPPPPPFFLPQYPFIRCLSHRVQPESQQGVRNRYSGASSPECPRLTPGTAWKFLCGDYHRGPGIYSHQGCVIVLGHMTLLCLVQMALTLCSAEGEEGEGREGGGGGGGGGRTGTPLKPAPPLLPSVHSPHFPSLAGLVWAL